jgi:antirestriction protein ArdC
MASTVTEPRTDQTSRGNPTPRDHRQEVTDGIVRLLEQGVAPWQKPWEPGSSSLGMPMNPVTGNRYRGGNAIHLLAAAMETGYEDPRWMTYKQAFEQGWQVRKGEKGTQIEFWDVKPASDRTPPDRPGQQGGRQESGDDSDRNRQRLIHRVYTVFNAQQVERIPPFTQKQHSSFEAVQTGEQILENSGARIAHDQADRAFYSRAQDSIHLPPKDSFKDPAGYYGTALHELAHWTGHPSRLDRSTLNESYRFGDVNYAREELRAELASVFLAAERGIPHDPEHHAAYVGSWIKALKQDKNEIFRAAHDASKATDFLLTLERARSVGNEGLAAGPVSGTEAGSSSAAVIVQKTEDIHRDRELIEETLSESDLNVSDEMLADHMDIRSEKVLASSGNANEHSVPARESTDTVARYEPGSGTINVHAKETATDRRTTVDSPDSVTESLKNAHSITTQVLGESAKTLTAHTESGNYRGAIIGETDHHVVQRQSGKAAVAHPKELLDQQPETGQVVRINYSNERGTVREFRDRAKAKEISR